MNGNIEKNSDASEGRMNKRSFLKKLDVGAADLREHGSRCACNQTRS